MPNEQLQEQTHLIRAVEAHLKVSVPDVEELRFRGSLLAKASAELKNLKPGFVLRLYEAACDVKFPSDEVEAFRLTLQREIGLHLNLRAYRQPNAKAA
jgi:hypothetical protein